MELDPIRDKRPLVGTSQAAYLRIENAPVAIAMQQTHQM